MTFSPSRLTHRLPPAAPALAAWLVVGVVLAIGPGCPGAGPGGEPVLAAAPAATESDAQPAPTPPPPPPRTVWIGAVGDIMLDRSVGKKIAANGPESILAKVRAQTRAPYLTFGNLECPLSDTGAHDPKNCVFRADPAAVKVMVDGGVDIVSLANNHTLDAGREAVLQTLATLEEHEIAYAGAHRERERSWEPHVFDVAGLKVGFMACTDLDFQHGSYAKIDADPEAATERVRAAKALCDLLFVSVHWGHEYHKTRSERQRKTAVALIDAGADCILGHHPHTLQGIGVYKGRPILYSMGNFVFDQRQGERMESAFFDIWWKEGHSWQIKATPVWIDSARMGPIYPSAERALTIATRLRDLSEALGTAATIEHGRVLVRIP